MMEVPEGMTLEQLMDELQIDIDPEDHLQQAGMIIPIFSQSRSTWLDSVASACLVG